MSFLGTSIGFKNIASKIAYDLRLWLNRQPSTTTNSTSNNINNNNNSIPPTIHEKSIATDETSETWSFGSCGDDVIEISLNDSGHAKGGGKK